MASPPPPIECRHDKIALIIATLGQRPAIARRTLEAIARQRCTRCEVIVVLNGGDNAPFEEMLREYPVRVIRVPWAGQSRAQNLGIRATDASLLIFTDDDVVPHDDWLHQLIACFDSPEVGCVTGRAELVGPTYLRQSVVYSERSLSRWTLSPHDADWVTTALRYDIGIAANQAFRRETLLRMGLIPEDLSGGAAIDTVESELYLKVLYNGYSLCHNPDAVVDLYFDDPPEVQKARLRGMRAAGVALYLKLLLEDRGVKGLRWRIFKGLLHSIRRRLTDRSCSTDTDAGVVRLSGMQSLFAYLYGTVLYWRSLADSRRARERAAGEQAAGERVLQ